MTTRASPKLPATCSNERASPSSASPPTARKPYGALEISVSDDGVGGTDPRRGSGTIGLQDRIDVLGGSMEVASRAGGGTTLRVTLPG
jgi:nitrate/nitrite-specific signal transduction histidine kinase